MKWVTFLCKTASASPVNEDNILGHGSRTIVFRLQPSMATVLKASAAAGSSTSAKPNVQ
jgi:hypothetical protein